MDNFPPVEKIARYTQTTQYLYKDLSTAHLELRLIDASQPGMPGTASEPRFLLPTSAPMTRNISPTITVQPSGLCFEQGQAGQSILLSALVASIRLPNSCRNGTCRTCMCKLVSGEVRYQIEWPGLTREEKAEGWVLPCVAVAESDVVLDVPSAVDLKR